MKQIEADCLLRLHSGALYAVFSDIANTNVAAAPEIVQVLHLGAKLLLESLVHYPIQCPLSTPAEFFGPRQHRPGISIRPTLVVHSHDPWLAFSALDMSDMPVIERWMGMTCVTISEAISSGHQTKVLWKSGEPNLYSLHVGT